ncbi:MAG: SAM-dependent methyltransferase [Coxiellaceae bacterium]|nr:SAM-dependent methyltransferase [Coxiellaceae bacterium]
MKDQEITIAENQRFSECLFWDMQRDFYDKQGINAWNKKVPFHATCNPYIADCYANIVMSFIKDWLTLHPTSIEHPFYIMELGAGSGMFSFYILKSVHELAQKLQLDTVKIIYVMTDFTASNLNHWQQHPALQSYLEDGRLDFAFFDLESEQDIELLHSNKILSKDTLINPLMVAANYIFDSISTDVFTAKEGEIFESLVNLKTTAENMCDGKPINWDDIELSYQPTANDLRNYYDDDNFNQVLNSYQGRLNDADLLFPIASLRAIRKLANTTNGRLILISSDLSHNYVDQLEGNKAPKPKLSCRNWVSVNYDAIAQYFKLIGGDVVLQPYGKRLNTNVFLLGEQLNNLPETRREIKQRITGFSPSDFLVVTKSKKKQLSELELEELVSLLRLSRWDPQLFHLYSEQIYALIGKASSNTKHCLIAAMTSIEAHYYYMPASYNTLLEIGRFFQTIKEYSTALDYYAKSEAYFGKQFSLISSKAFCTYHLGSSNDAREMFNEAAALVPKMDEVAIS